MPFRLSIVIPSHDRADLLRDCLETVCRHAPPQTEIIVVDDGSPNAVASKVADLFPGVRAIRLARRQGFCIAANAGIRAAKGEVIELLNDDTEVIAGWSEHALANFTDNGVGAVAPLVLCGSALSEKPAQIDSAGDHYFLGGFARKRGHGEPLTSDYLQPCRVFGASASSAFYRRAALERVGAFPEDFGAYFEDVDLSFRLQHAGYHIRFEPASRVFHRGGSSYGRQSRRLLEQQSRNEERVFWRNVIGTSMWQALPLHLLVLAAKAGKRWSEGTLTPWLLGRLRVLGEWNDLQRHRRWLHTLSVKKPTKHRMFNEPL